MSKALSVDLRERVFRAYRAGVGSLTEVAKQFSIGRASLVRWVRREKRTGSLAPSTTRGKPPRLLDGAAIGVIGQMVRAQPDHTLLELAEDYQRQTGKSLSPASIYRGLARSGYTRKKKRSLQASKKASESRSFAQPLSNGVMS